MFNQTKFISALLFIILWQALSIAFNSAVFPSVIDIVASLAKHTFHGDLLQNLYVTLYRVFIAFFITMILGIFLGIVMGVSRKLNDSLDFLLILGLNVPALVIIVVCYIWFGLSDFAALLAVILNKVPIVIVNIREGVRAIEKRYLELGKVYKVSKSEIFFKLFLPQIYPYIMASIRLTLSLTWKIVLVVELLGRSDGVGFAISMFFQFFDITSILAYTLAFIFVILFIEYFILNSIEKKINFWK